MKRGDWSLSRYPTVQWNSQAGPFYFKMGLIQRDFIAAKSCSWQRLCVLLTVTLKDVKFGKGSKNTGIYWVCFFFFFSLLTITSKVVPDGLPQKSILAILYSITTNSVFIFCCVLGIVLVVWHSVSHLALTKTLKIW